jgi:hypothetical protein
MSSRVERLIEGIALGVAVLFAAVVLVWRVGFDDAPWTWTLPRMYRWESFEVYSLVPPVGVIAIAGILVVAALRRHGRAVGPSMAVVVSMATVVIYLPLWFMTDSRVDRLRGELEVPVYVLRKLVGMVILTLASSVLFLAIATLRRTPSRTRHVALGTTVILNGVLLHLMWFQMFVPMTNRWLPIDWYRPDLLVPVRPCRGAVVWSRSPSGKDRDIGNIDDVWLRFADPRNAGAPAPALSVSGDWDQQYYWLAEHDLRELRVRSDDPALADCDSHPRRERVAPAAWHKLGVK